MSSEYSCQSLALWMLESPARDKDDFTRDTTEVSEGDGADNSSAPFGIIGDDRTTQKSYTESHSSFPEIQQLCVEMLMLSISTKETPSADGMCQRHRQPIEFFDLSICSLMCLVCRNDYPYPVYPINCVVPHLLHRLSHLQKIVQKCISFLEELSKTLRKRTHRMEPGDIDIVIFSFSTSKLAELLRFTERFFGNLQNRKHHQNLPAICNKVYELLSIPMRACELVIEEQESRVMPNLATESEFPGTVSHIKADPEEKAPQAQAPEPKTSERKGSSTLFVNAYQYEDSLVRFKSVAEQYGVDCSSDYEPPMGSLGGRSEPVEVLSYAVVVSLNERRNARPQRKGECKSACEAPTRSPANASKPSGALNDASGFGGILLTKSGKEPETADGSKPSDVLSDASGFGRIPLTKSGKEPETADGSKPSDVLSDASGFGRIPLTKSGKEPETADGSKPSDVLSDASGCKVFPSQKAAKNQNHRSSSLIPLRTKNRVKTRKLLTAPQGC